MASFFEKVESVITIFQFASLPVSIFVNIFLYVKALINF